MGIALLALVNALVALYLHLWKLGKVGTLNCASGQGCLTAQFSQYGSFLGVDVALIGAIGYALILAIALWGISDADDPRPTAVLAGLAVVAVLFTWRLKYGEWVVLKVFCSWCAISAVSIHAIALLVWIDRRRLRRAVVAGSGSAAYAAPASSAPAEGR